MKKLLTLITLICFMSSCTMNHRVSETKQSAKSQKMQQKSLGKQFQF